MIKKYLCSSVALVVLLSPFVLHASDYGEGDVYLPPLKSIETSVEPPPPLVVPVDDLQATQQKLADVNRQVADIDSTIADDEATALVIQGKVEKEYQYQEGVFLNQQDELDSLRGELDEENARLEALKTREEALARQQELEAEQTANFEAEKLALLGQVKQAKEKRQAIESQVVVIKEGLDSKRDTFAKEQINHGVIVINPKTPLAEKAPLNLDKTFSESTDPKKTECDLLTALGKQFEPPTYLEVEKYPEELQRLIAMGNPNCDEKGEKKNNEIQKMRPKAIKEAAYIVAIQTAVKWRYQRITEIMDSVEDELNEAYDFTPLLMYNNRLLPPVITKASSSFKLENSDTAISSDATYRIIQEAKIVTHSPSWRDYIWKQFSAIEEVNQMLLPKDEEEERAWKEAIIDGWKQGMLQAHRLYAINLSRLVRDYNGMVTYMILEHQNVVSMPKLSEGQYSVKISEGGKALDVDQKVFRITKKIGFQDVESWVPEASTVN